MSFLTLGFVCLCFQNCGGGFESLSESGSLSSASDGEAYGSASIGELKQSCELQSEDVAPTSMRRLTSDEYMHTVWATLDCPFNCFYLDFRNLLIPAFELLPIEQTHDSISTFIRFSNLDQNISEERVAAYHTTAMAAADAIENFPLAREVGIFRLIFDSCYAGTDPDVACLDKMLSNVGRRAFRRPLTPEQLGHVKTAMGSSGTIKARLGRAVYFLLMSPNFVYHVESEGQLTGVVLSLDQYTIASRMSYLLTGYPPDNNLLDRAARNELITKAGLEAAADYLKQTYLQRVKDQMWHFVSEWLKVPTNAMASDAKTSAFVSFNLGQNSTTLRNEMNLELRKMFEYYFFDNPGSYGDLLTNQKFFSTTPLLASLHGLPVWNGTSAPPSHPAGQRRGFLTTSALLTTGLSTSNPFAMGGLVHKHILCREFGNNPEPKVFPVFDEADDTKLMTTRERFEKLVPRYSSCMNCHSQIESVGMPFQTYDLFGRYRAGVETVIDPAGKTVGSIAINANHTPVLDNRTMQVSGAVDLVDKMAATSEPQACFARQYIRFANGRADDRRDSCTTYRFANKLQSGTIWDAMKSYIVDDWFAKRRLN